MEPKKRYKGELMLPDLQAALVPIIRKRRREQNKSQIWMAQTLGVSVKFYQQWESCERPLHLEAYKEICNVLGVIA